MCSLEPAPTVLAEPYFRFLAVLKACPTLGPTWQKSVSPTQHSPSRYLYHISFYTAAFLLPCSVSEPFSHHDSSHMSHPSLKKKERLAGCQFPRPIWELKHILQATQPIYYEVFKINISTAVLHVCPTTNDFNRTLVVLPEKLPLVSLLK